MTPIAAIPPIDSALKLLEDSGHAIPTPLASPELADKFQALMQRQSAEASAPSASQGIDSVAGVIEHQQVEMTQVETSMQDFIEKAPSLDPTERFAASAELMEKESMVHMKMALAMGVTKASNKSLQTLLTNQ